MSPSVSKCDESPVMLTIREAAAIARVGTVAIRVGVAKGVIPHMRFGTRKVLIPRDKFITWLIDSASVRRSGGAPNAQ